MFTIRRLTVVAGVALVFTLLAASAALASLAGKAELSEQRCHARSVGYPYGYLSLSAIQTEEVYETQAGFIPQTNYVEQRMAPQYLSLSGWKNLQPSSWFRIDTLRGFVTGLGNIETVYWPDPSGNPMRYRPNYSGYRYHVVVQFRWWDERSYYPDNLLGTASVTSASCRAR